MNEPSIRNPAYGALTDQQFDQIDLICDRFDQELVKGDSPRIEAFLEEAPEAARDGLLAELLAIELEYRTQQGDEGRPDEYHQRFPQQVSIVDNVFRCAEVTHLPGGGTIAIPVNVPPVLANFRLIKQIGSGGMGVVWLAEQDHPVKRKVALKLIRAELTSNDVLLRFNAEKQALAMMDHPNIARVLDAGTTDNDRPYFVMELVDGVPITQYCDDNKLSVDERLNLFVPVCKAVQHAHQKGIVHRDLKPSNVLVTVVDGQAVPKVIDFGLAKAVEHHLTLTDETMQTEFGKVVGTVQYMSPEQAELKGLDAQNIDTRTDVYSLGVMLYELLTGSTPLDEETLAQNALLKILEIIRQQEPPRPSFRLSTSSHDANSVVADLRRLQPARLQQLLKGELDWVVMKAIEKEPDRRYQTASDFAQDLSNYLSGGTVTARPPSTWYQLQKFARRNFGLVTAVMAIAVALIVGIAGTSYGLMQANQKAAEADKERGKATANEKRALREKSKAETNEQRAIAAENLANAEARRAGDSETTAKFQLANARWEANRASDARNLLNQIPLEYRDTFEWHYCKRRFQGSDVTCFGHTDEVLEVVYGPDGTWLASASRDGTIKFWDPVSGQQVSSIEAHEGSVRALAVSRDGSYLASAGYDQLLKLWDAESHELIRTIRDHEGPINAVTFSPNGDRIASASDDQTIKLWDTATGNEINTISGHTAGVSDIAFTPDGKRLASCSNGDQTVRIWDSHSGQPITILLQGELDLRKVEFSPDGARLLAIRYGTFFLWDTENWQRLEKTVQAHDQEVRCVAFSPDGTQFATGAGDPTVKLWDTQSGQQLASFCGHAKTVSGLAFSPDGTRLVSGSHDQTVKIWDICGKTNMLTIPETSRPFNVTFSDDGKQYASSGFDGKIVLRDALTNEIRFRLQGHSRGVEVDELCFSPDGSRLISAGYNDHTVRVWDTNTGHEAATLTGHESLVRSVAFSPDQSQFASGSWDGTVKLWDANTYQEIATLTGHQGGLYCVAFSPDGSLLASSSSDRTVKLWDARTGRELKTFSGHNGSVRTVVFGPHGNKLLSAGDDWKALVWDIASGKHIAISHLNAQTVFEATFSPDGKRFATASVSPGIHLYDSLSGQEIIALEGISGSSAVEFSPDGTRLAGAFTVAAAERKNCVRIWDAPKEHETTVFSGHTEPVTRVTFSADGSRIYSESENEKLVWDVTSLKTGWQGLEQRTSATSKSLKSPPNRSGLSSHAQSSPALLANDAVGHATILDDADWKPPEAPVRTSPDGRWFVISEANNIVLVDLEYKNTPAESGYRKSKARFDPLWHQHQSKAAVTVENWYAAVFHDAWLVKNNPQSMANCFALRSSYRRLIAQDPVEIEVLSQVKDRTGNRDGTYFTNQKQKQIVTRLPATREASTEESTKLPTEVSNSNHALYFDGASYVDFGNLSFYKANFTVEGWIRMDAPSPDSADPPEGHARRAVFTVLSGQTSPAFAAEVDTNDCFRVIHRNPPSKGGGIDLRSQSRMTDGQWHHFAVVKDGDDLLHLYIDGKLEASSAERVTNFGDTPYSVFLGVLHEKHPRYFKGLMDDIRFWNDARTKDEITSHMSSEIDPASEGLVAAYEFHQAKQASSQSQQPNVDFYLSPVVHESLNLAPSQDSRSTPASAKMSHSITTANPKAYGVKRLQALLIGGRDSDSRFLGMTDGRVGIPMKSNADTESVFVLSVERKDGGALLTNRDGKYLTAHGQDVVLTDTPEAGSRWVIRNPLKSDLDPDDEWFSLESADDPGRFLRHFSLLVYAHKKAELTADEAALFQADASWKFVDSQ